MTISAELVKDLREKTGAGMMDCKKALAQSGGNLEKALDFLRKQGLATAAKKAGRTAADGLIGMLDEKGTYTMIEVNCETDFVSKTDDFQNFLKDVTSHVAKNNFSNVDDLLSSTMNGKKVADIQTAIIAKLGENIGVRRFVKKPSGGDKKVNSYVHAGSKIGVLVVFEDPNGKLPDNTAKDVAMHVAAMSPQYVTRNEIPEDVMNREKEIFKAQMADQKKPADVMEKIIIGKLNKQFSEMCLEDQIFVKDPVGKQSIGKMLKSIDGGIKVTEFARFQVGEKV